MHSYGFTEHQTFMRYGFLYVVKTNLGLYTGETMIVSTYCPKNRRGFAAYRLETLENISRRATILYSTVNIYMYNDWTFTERVNGSRVFYSRNFPVAEHEYTVRNSQVTANTEH